MSKPIPPIQKFMTTSPAVLGPTTSVKEAHELMHRFRVRHLPICEGQTCVGVVSDGDLFRAEALLSADPGKLRTADVMSSSPYVVSPASPVDEVVAEMARRKLGSAVVVDNGKVVGIFTSIDALNAFAELLHTRLKN